MTTPTARRKAPLTLRLRPPCRPLPRCRPGAAPRRPRSPRSLPRAKASPPRPLPPLPRGPLRRRRSGRTCRGRTRAPSSQPGDDGRLVRNGDRVVRLGFQDLGERSLGLLELAELDVRPAQSVTGLDVIGRGLEDLLIELERARPVGIQRRRGGLIAESARTNAAFTRRCHGSSSNA